MNEHSKKELVDVCVSRAGCMLKTYGPKRAHWLKNEHIVKKEMLKHL
jgi:hypothetical protein